MGGLDEKTLVAVGAEETLLLGGKGNHPGKGREGRCVHLEGKKGRARKGGRARREGRKGRERIQHYKRGGLEPNK